MSIAKSWHSRLTLVTPRSPTRTGTCTAVPELMAIASQRFERFRPTRAVEDAS